MADIIRLHRMVELPVKTLDDIAREHGVEAQYRPDPIEMLRERLNERPSYLRALAADWRDFISEVRASPYSHALVAILTVIGWTALLVLPLLIGAGK